MLTIQQIKDLKISILKDLEKEKKEAIKMIKDGDIQNVDCENSFIVSHIEYSSELFGLDYDELKQEILDFEEMVTKIQNDQDKIFCCYETYTYHHSEEDDSYQLGCKYYDLGNKIEILTKMRLKKTIEDELKKDHGVNSYSYLKCEALEMYMNEDITWKGLMKLTFGICER